jgi:hypothetical protein
MEASRSIGAALARRRILWRSAVFALTGGSVAYAAALVACGGSTGREGLSTPDSGGDDATLDGGFDVEIQYIDRLLPDLYVAPMDAGGGEASDWPSCAPDIPVVLQLAADGAVTGYTINADGGIPATGIPYEIPAVWQDDGGEVPAPDGSACATHVWLGSPACDECAREQGGIVGPLYGQYGETTFLPPCSDLGEAGIAVAGPGANRPRLDLCRAMLRCMVDTGCYLAGTGSQCLCEAGDQCSQVGPTGVCSAPIQAAFEIQGSSPGDTYTKIGMAYISAGFIPPNAPGHGGATLGALFNALVASCQEQCAADAASE